MAKIASVLLAAGIGTRVEAKIPKPYIKLGDFSVLTYSIIKLHNHELIDAIQVVINPAQQELYNKVIEELPFKANKLLKPVFGGDRRQDSARIGLQAINYLSPKYVLIHDAARPFITRDLIDTLIKELKYNQAIIPVLPIFDTIKKVENNKVVSTISREKLFVAHTPQAFIYETILTAHQQYIELNATDDLELCEKLGISAKIVESSLKNFKITTNNDLKMAQYFMENEYETRIGIGFDVHKLAKSDVSNLGTIKLGGVKVPHHQDVIAHSDGDVVLHALCDALFGAMGAGDIGLYFPPTDDKWKNADSREFVKYALEMLKEKNGIIINIDVIIIAESPKIQPYRLEIQENVAKLLLIPASRVNIKATTTEKMGFTGRKEGIASQVIANIKLPFYS